MSKIDLSLVATYVSEVLGAQSLLVDVESRTPMQSAAAAKEEEEEEEVVAPEGVDLQPADQGAQLQQGIQAELPPAQGARLVFLSMRTPRSSLMAGPGFELFKKMRGAMALAPQQAPLVELNPRELSPAFSLPGLEAAFGLSAPPRYVIFSSELISKLGYGVHNEGSSLSVSGRELLCTYDPRVLLKDPEKKRAAWEDLKPLAKELES